MDSAIEAMLLRCMHGCKHHAWLLQLQRLYLHNEQHCIHPAFCIVTRVRGAEGQRGVSDSCLIPVYRI